jgi:hypothetical protein
MMGPLSLYPSSNSSVGVAFIQVFQDRLMFVSLDSVHSQVYPFLALSSSDVPVMKHHLPN